MLRAVAAAVVTGAAALAARRYRRLRGPCAPPKLAPPAATVPMRACDEAGAAPPAALLATVAAAGQAHVFRGWPELDAAGRAALVADMESVDLPALAAAHATAVATGDDAASARGGACAPWTAVADLDGAPPSTRAAWTSTGLAAAAAGRVAVLILAGGQGTRLGSAAPKGCFDIGLPSRTSLFGLHAGRVAKLRALAAAHAAEEGGEASGTVHLYIMTSPATHDATVAFWAGEAWFGLGAETVHFVPQATIPAVTEGGRLILETPSSIARSPNGNGGVYQALLASGALDRMDAHAVASVDIVCVDNALARGGDPAFVGACLEAGAAVGCRALRRAAPEEKVGVFAADARGRLRVLEYSELSEADAKATVEGGAPLYGWANICMHHATPSFLRAAAADLGAARPLYHAARKTIASVDGPVAGVKLELFIFDAFDSAPPSSVALFAVDRASSFAPVKGATGADTPADARAAVLAQGGRWVVAAGGVCASGEGVEVAPSVSLAGEGLAPLVAGRAIESADGAALVRAARAAGGT